MPKRKNPHAVALGRLGGKARAKSLTDEQKSEIARRAGVVGGQRRADALAAMSSAGVGGKARAAKLTAEQRREIAKKAAAVRWAKRDRES